MLKSLLKDKHLISGWVNTVINTAFGLVLLPFILSKFSAATLNVWFLFFSVINLSGLIVFGFNSTFVRFVSYTITGIHYNDFNNIKLSTLKYSNINKEHQLNEIFTINIIVFIIIGTIYLFFVLLIGYFFLSKPISYVQNPSAVWIAWYILVFANAINIMLYTYPVFLQGLNAISIFYNIQSVLKVIYIISAIIILIFIPSILSLTIVYSVVLLLTALSFFFILKFKLIGDYKFKFTHFNKKLFVVIWESAWKSGITKILAPIVQYFSGILFAQVATPGVSSSYLLTQRLFDLLQTFSNTTINSKIPTIAMLRSKSKYDQLMPLLKNLSFIAYSIIFIGYIILVLSGSSLLTLIHSKTTLADYNILILFSFAYLIDRNGGLQLNLANQANKVIEHKAIVIYAIIYFSFLFVFIKNLQMWVFPTAMILAQIVTSLYALPITYKLYNTTFFKFEKKGFIPIIILLTIFNVGYYLFSK